jgi:hypothetical protein
VERGQVYSTNRTRKGLGDGGVPKKVAILVEHQVHARVNGVGLLAGGAQMLCSFAAVVHHFVDAP